MSSQSSTGSGKSIFISYRRDDSSANTGRIYDRLIQQFDRESIFKDVDAIPIGVDFRKHLEKQVVGCKVLLAIIGPRWAGNDRLQDEGDFVRIEIEYGLDPDRDILVVPVLVDNASMPPTDQLPESLKDFAFRNAIQVRPDPDFHKDMDKLIKSLANVVGAGFAGQERGLEAKTPTHMPYRISGREFYEPKELAVYLSENWTEGVKQFGRGLITDWVKNDYRDQGLASNLTDILEEGELDGDQKLSVALLVMNNELSVFWRGDEVTLQWQVANPKEAVKMLGGPLPDWHAKLCGNPYHANTRKAWQTWQAKVGELNIPVDWDKVFDLFLRGEQERDVRFMALCKKFTNGEYVGSKDQRIQNILDHNETGPVNQIVLLCCDQDLFITPKEMHRLDSVAYLREFEVNMDWELAKKLISSDSWGEINPLWKKALSLPLRPFLMENEKIRNIYFSKEVQYLDVVALVTAEAAEAESHERAGECLWQFMTGGYVCSPAIGTDGTVYVGSRDKKVYALDGKTGAKKWEFESGGEVWSSPAIGSDGTVYVGSRDNRVYALDGQSGAKKWEFVTGGNVDSSPAIGAGGIVCVGSKDKKVYALDCETGTKKWGFESGGKVISSPAIGADGTVYVGSNDNKIYALYKRSGTKKWEFASGGSAFSSPAIGADGTVCIGLRDLCCYALDGKTGAKKWEFITRGEIFSSPAIGADGTVYIGSGDKKIYALDGKTGELKWGFLTGGNVTSSPAIGSDGTVYVGSLDKKVYALNPDGTKKWEFETGDKVASSPVIGSDGTIYVGSDDGKLYAIRTASKGLANSPWPMRGQNAQHTGRTK